MTGSYGFWDDLALPTLGSAARRATVIRSAGVTRVQQGEAAVDDAKSGRSVGPIALAPGVTPSQLYAFATASLIGFSLIVGINTLQPYLLSGQLHVEHAIQGRIVSAFAILQECVALLLVPPLGALADRVGRRPILVAGLATLAVGLALYPLTQSLIEFALARLVTAIGAAALSATIATLAADIPLERSRGKLLSTLLVTQQLAILLIVARVAARLPQWLAGFGVDAVEAGHYSFWLIALLGALGALVAWLGLASRGPVLGSASRPAAVPAPTVNALGAMRSLRAILGFARAQPRFAVVLAIAFVVRGDLSVTNSYLSLWAVGSAKHQGVSEALGLRYAGDLLFGLTLAGLAASLATGFLVDRFRRLSVLVCVLALAAVGHISIACASDPRSVTTTLLVLLLGAGEASLVIAGQALLGQEAPAERRGAAIGVFGFCGSLGVLAINVIGGYLFDKLSAQSPFVVIGTVDLAILAWASRIWWRERAVRSGGSGVLVVKP
jgi:MFS family permease